MEALRLCETTAHASLALSVITSIWCRCSRIYPIEPFDPRGGLCLVNAVTRPAAVHVSYATPTTRAGRRPGSSLRTEPGAPRWNWACLTSAGFSDAAASGRMIPTASSRNRAVGDRAVRLTMYPSAAWPPRTGRRLRIGRPARCPPGGPAFSCTVMLPRDGRSWSCCRTRCRRVIPHHHTEAALEMATLGGARALAPTVRFVFARFPASARMSPCSTWRRRTIRPRTPTS